MGLVVILKFAAKRFDILAWPLFALGYPLCASIRAIELNSNSDIRKLVTYWVLFSLISLFDHVFVKLLEWLPFWPYLKLMVICWLVIPHFDSAFYVYEHLVWPCLSMNPRVVINQFNKPKEEFFLQRENFLVAAERYVKVNGSEALEKLIASKVTKPNLDGKEIKAVTATEKKEVAAADWSKCIEPNVAQKDIKAVELTGNKEAPAAKWLKCAEPNLAQIEKKTVAAEEVKKTAAAAAAAAEAGRDNELPEIPALKKVQKEWACALCQVTTQSETTLKSHLQGKGHKAKCKDLKANKAVKNKGSSASTAKKSGQPKEEPKKCVSGNGPNKKSGQPKEEPKKCVSGNGPNKQTSEKQEKKVQVNGISDQCKQKKPKNPGANEMKHSTLWCSICNVRCPGEIDMASHLSGRKHLDRMQGLIGWE